VTPASDGDVFLAKLRDGLRTHNTRQVAAMLLCCATATASKAPYWASIAKRCA